MILKHKADAVPAQLRQGVIVKALRVLAMNEQTARGRAIQKPDNVQERAFART